MIQRVRIGILVAVLGILLLHFTMVWLFVNPFQSEPHKNFWGQWYCSPFFSQGWNLFVPVPRNNYMIFVEYKTGGQIVKREIFRSLVETHRANRLGGNEGLVIAFTNSIHYFEHATTLRSRLNGPVENDLYFNIVRHAALNYTASLCDCEPYDFRMILYVQPLDGPGRAYY